MSTKLNLPSQEDIAKQTPKFSMLQNQEEYIGYIGAIREIQQDAYNNPGVKEDRLAVDMLVISEKDGSPLVGHPDEGKEEGDPIKPLSLMITKYGVNPSAMGFQKDNTPSNFRALIAYGSGQNIAGGLVLDSLDDLVGNYIAFSCIHKSKQDGTVKHTVGQFKKLPKNFVTPDQATKNLHKAAFQNILNDITAKQVAKAQGGSQASNKSANSTTQADKFLAID